MIKLLAEKYNKPIALILLSVFYIQLLSGFVAYGQQVPFKLSGTNYGMPLASKNGPSKSNSVQLNSNERQNKYQPIPKQIQKEFAPEPPIGGPAAPEASSFKSVGADNLVNLFTGDFSYNIPLLDVGGYPVNIYYNAGIGMEQEASWVGLGWNINPGSVSRNMRGVPDDFNGEDQLIQEQNTKPNRTWGASLGTDLEIFGFKKPVPNLKLNLGLSYNNYLGPAVELGAGTSLSLLESKQYEKKATDSAFSLGLSLNFKLSSRSGLTISPSLNAKLPLEDKKHSLGLGVSTSYNSRTGLADLTLSSQSNLNLSKFKVASDNINEYINSHSASNISFARPTYLPTLRMPMRNLSYSARLELGSGAFGVRGSGTVSGFYTESKVPEKWQVVTKPLFGFLFSDRAVNNRDAVMDFNRINDGAVTPNTPIISAPQYAYDIFSIQGEGTGGSIRAYRGDVGFMKDNFTRSDDAQLSIGGDIAPPFHYGANVDAVYTPTSAGAWTDNRNKLAKTLNFQPNTVSIQSSFENVYFRNPGESTIANAEMIDNLGGDNLVRFALGGSKAFTTAESTIELFNKKDISYISSKTVNNKVTARDKRTQVINFLNAADAAKIGLDKKIKNYTGTFSATTNFIQYLDTDGDRVNSYRKAHHISQINVLEQSGMRYVYGVPIYNRYQKEYTFSVSGVADSDNQVPFTASEATAKGNNRSPHFDNKSKIDGYVMTQQTPAYATAFLLSGLLNPDYVDVTGDGITEDDLGSAVKFNYKKSDDLHKWRTPRKNGNTAQLANFIDGSKTETKDNKASITYGEREVWYLSSIESKTSVALFTTASRLDAKGVYSAFDGRVNPIEDANKRLVKIDLYSKAEIKAKGFANAVPLKTVHFDYDYSLCKNTPDNAGTDINQLGKLTLKSIYFTYYGKPRAAKDKYVFQYGSPSTTPAVYPASNQAASVNPDYAYNSSDKWGTYKSKQANPLYNGMPLPNEDFPYTNYNKATADVEAGAWSLSKILLPSGGQMEVQYEADDYAYVQNRRSCDMMSIYGLGTTPSASVSGRLYKGLLGTIDQDYVYVKLNQPLEANNSAAQKAEIAEKYLESLNQLLFKLKIQLPKGGEPLTIYANYEDYGLCPNSSNKDLIFLKLKKENGKNPLVKTAIRLLLDNYPNQAFEGYEVEIESFESFASMMTGMLSSLINAFTNAEQQMKNEQKASLIDLNASFVRLANPLKTKIGGGVRVKRVLVKDNWDKMKGKFTATYGQDYDYTITEKVNGLDKTFSSGVASYEPGIGSEENPFREIVKYSDKLPLAPAQYGVVEMPMLESFFPSPNVGYSRVTVRSIHRKATIPANTSIKSAIGRQVTEFYTAKEFPSTYAYTTLSSSVFQFKPKINVFFNTQVDKKTVSQGFLVETNDMHGKMKSQKAFAESDELTPISATTYYYKNTGTNGLNDKVNFVNNKQGGVVTKGNMGIDMELMTDVRQFKAQVYGAGVQAQVDFIPLIFFPPFPVVTILGNATYNENKYRAVTCTKLINYHSIEDSVIVMDKGSTITTKTIAYDAETGAAIVTKTANEFKDPIYNTSYPAYWAYSGMGLAYENIDRRVNALNFNNGKITNLTPSEQNALFESGDELYITGGAGTEPGSCVSESVNVNLLWAFDKNKNTTPLTVMNKDLVFMDAKGNLYNKTGVNIRIVRSGKRNSIGASLASFTSMEEPFVTVGNTTKLDVVNVAKVVSASAIEYKEKWQTDGDIFFKYKYTYNPTSCVIDTVLDCINGELESRINPYVKGLVGNFKPYRSYTYYGSRNEKDLTTPANVQTDIRKQGYLENFYGYWKYDINNNLVQNTTNATQKKWVFNSEITRVNSKGQELETRNALNIYTAAQYGYLKNLTTAVANNSKVNEMLAEGFEEEGYGENINFVNSICKSMPLSFNVEKAIIVDGSITPIKAHSGKKYLKILEGTNITTSREIKLSTSSSNNEFDLIPTTGSNYNLINPGTNFYDFSNANPFGGTVPIGPAASYQGVLVNYPPASACGTYSFTPIVTPEIVAGKFCYNYFFSYNAHYFIDIPADGIYQVELGAMPTPVGIAYGTIDLQITDANNAAVYNQTLFANDVDVANTYNVCFKKGINKVAFKLSSQHLTCITQNSLPGTFTYKVKVLNAGNALTCYRDMALNTNCNFNKPIAASQDMINTGFAPVPGKKMWFSTWVREDCALPCTTTNYSNSKVKLFFKDANNNFINANNPIVLSTIGNIIEHWQKIEGEFVIPTNAASMIIELTNDNSPGSAAYWDDMRMHPFNANMKHYAYDDKTLRVMAELDENNYAAFYEYDEEGQLIRVKKETVQGIKTIKETRSAKQKQIVTIQ